MPDPYSLVVAILEQARFNEIAKLRHLKVDHGLVTCLVERSRPETHTFHFSIGE